jgi:hypothetical protein
MLEKAPKFFRGEVQKNDFFVEIFRQRQRNNEVESGR